MLFSFPQHLASYLRDVFVDRFDFWFAFGIWIAVLGHIYFAIRDPIALGGMTRGSVTPYWARTERPAWYREMTGEQSERVEERTPR